MPPPKLNPGVAVGAGPAGLGWGVAPLNVKVEDGAFWACVAAPKLGGATGAADGAVVPPKAKPVEVAPNAGLAGVPKVVAVVAPVDPKGKGVGPAVEGAGFDAGVDDALPFPKVKGFGAAGAEPKVDCGAGASNAVFPKVNVDCVVAAATVVVVEEAVPAMAVPAMAEPAMAKPPNDAVVVLAAAAVWPNENTF